ncbi:MAG: VTT domain-containing protein [Nannocystaceae bacterium]
MDTTSPNAQADAAGPDLRLRRLLWSTFATLAALFAVVVTTGFFFHAELLASSRWFVEKLGGPGVALGFFIPDAFTVPLPNDAFSTAGLVGGMDYWQVVAWGSMGSLAGGSTGYWIGRSLLSRSRRLREFLARRGGDVAQQIQRGNKFLLAAAALTPMPYSVVCWAAGAVRMPFGAFLAISSLRIVRVSGWLWLIEQGLVSLSE